VRERKGEGEGGNGTGDWTPMFQTDRRHSQEFQETTKAIFGSSQISLSQLRLLRNTQACKGCAPSVNPRILVASWAESYVM
jgi:hypothetical protein